jgi:hypothetical protein
MRRLQSPVVVGVLCAIPVALLMGWFATLIFDPAGGGPASSATPYGSIPRVLGMGPLRGVAFGVGALIAAGFVAPKLAREDLGSLGGLAVFVGLGHLLAGVGVALDVAVRDPGSLGPSILFAWPLALILTLGGSLILWLPTGAVWVSAVRRLTIKDEPAPTAYERALSERRRNEAAREHVITDATNLADQGSRLYRNRG